MGYYEGELVVKALDEIVKFCEWVCVVGSLREFVLGKEYSWILMYRSKSILKVWVRLRRGIPK